MKRAAVIVPALLGGALRLSDPREGQVRMQNESSSVLDRFRHGNLEAFEALFRQHQREVFGWVLRIVRNPATAEEITVETFWRIYRAHARFEPERGFEGWARCIATHAALDHLRTVRSETELPIDPPAPTSGDPAISAEIRRQTAEAFERLPPKLRVAAILAVVEERPQKEVAEALGISVAAVKLRVFRALRLLRRDLQSRGITP
jgi:RNA polymerase sigma factor (sigma-70 family)